MKLTVFGSTGGVGTQLVRLALEQGHTVTAVMRNPAKFTLPGHEALHLVTIPDLADTDRVQAAVSGSDAVLSAVGPSRFKDVTAASVPTRHIVAALRGAGVERFVAVSAAPVTPAPDGEGFFGRRVIYPLMRRIGAGIYADLAVMEREIAASGLKWTVVRPPKLTDKPVARYRTTFGGNVVNGNVASRADVADAMLALIGDERAVGQAVGVAR